MFKEMLAEAKQAAADQELCEDLDFEYAERIASILRDKLSPLAELSRFKVETFGDEASADFENKVGTGETPRGSFTVTHKRPGFAYISCYVFKGRYTTKRAARGCDLNPENVARVVEMHLQERKGDFQDLISAWT